LSWVIAAPAPAEAGSTGRLSAGIDLRHFAPLHVVAGDLKPGPWARASRSAAHALHRGHPLGHRCLRSAGRTAIEKRWLGAARSAYWKYLACRPGHRTIPDNEVIGGGAVRWGLQVL